MSEIEEQEYNFLGQRYTEILFACYVGLFNEMNKSKKSFQVFKEACSIKNESEKIQLFESLNYLDTQSKELVKKSISTILDFINQKHEMTVNLTKVLEELLINPKEAIDCAKFLMKKVIQVCFDNFMEE